MANHLKRYERILKQNDKRIQEKNDDLIDFCRGSSDLKEAVYRAAAAELPNGKMHGHQSRNGRQKMKEFAVVLVNRREFLDALHRGALE